MFGPITTVRSGGQIAKKIPWRAFQLSDEDWERVKDVMEILLVHPFLALRLCKLLTPHGRIQIKFNITSPRNNSQPSGRPSQQLKSCKLHGRRGMTRHVLLNTRMPLTTAWRSFKSTIHAWTRSRVIFSH